MNQKTYTKGLESEVCLAQYLETYIEVPSRNLYQSTTTIRMHPIIFCFCKFMYKSKKIVKNQAKKKGG